VRVQRRTQLPGLPTHSDEFLVVAQHITIDLIERWTAQDFADRVELVFEGSDDPEITATAADGPEQIRVLSLIARHKVTGGRHHIGGDEIVTGKTASPTEITYATAESETGDARGRNDAARCRQTEGMGCVIQVTSGTTPFRAHRPPLRLDPHPFHLAQVEHQTIVASPEAGHAMAAAPHRQ